MERCTICAGCLLSSDPGSVFGQALLELLWCLNLDLLGRALVSRLARWRVARDRVALGLSCVEVCDDPLVVLLHNIFWHTLHAENLNVEALAVREGIFNLVKALFVDLVHVNRKTCEE